MLFNSIDFLLFFPIVTVLFFVLPHKNRWVLLLTASCFFYMFFKPEYILILFFTIIIDYFAGIYIEKTNQPTGKKQLLLLSLFANIGVLAIFKYYNFINDNITGIVSLFGCENPFPFLKILLPIGLSFHTFQAMSYTIEVYRGNQKAERHFGIYALYVMFYPQLVAGPIERPQNIIHQFHEKKNFCYDNAMIGLNLIVYGLFKKIVIADRLAPYVNQVYNDLNNANTISTIIASLFFSIQIYCDFSGYSDIARGTAKFMGYDLMINFDRPYLSESISEFWTRWHISLSTWFKDYLYIPLGGNRNGEIKWYRNLVIVFVLSGLWHGANWTFIIWGSLHAFYLIFGIATKYIRGKVNSFIFLDKFHFLSKTLSRLTVFGLVTFAWIFFRAKNIEQAREFINILLRFDFSLNIPVICAEKGPFNLIISFAVIGLLMLSYLLPKNLQIKHSTIFIIVTVFLIIILGKDAAEEFIYFQF
jgi:alginate O-acetyltransferase complex protein AlgI